MCTDPIKLEITRKNGEKDIINAPCGKCATCLKRRAKDWTIKLINEAKYHKEVCFATLTFSNEILLNNESTAVKKYGAKANFPYNIAYSKKYFNKFIKRLRKRFQNKDISYYHIAEYGEHNRRAHHHVLFFGINFNEDAKTAELSKSGKPQLFSQTLEDLWACGRTRFQEVNESNIAYIAGYNFKKAAFASTLSLDELTKKLQTYNKFKPIQTFSNRHKMSTKWVRKHIDHLITHGFLQDTQGKKYAIPKSYINMLKKEYENYEANNFDINKITNPEFIEAYTQYEVRRDDFIDKETYTERLNRSRKKERIEYMRNQYKLRDFE